MFFRLKPSGPRTYLQIVENRREDGAHRRHVIATPGRADELAASGALASLLASGARLCDQVMLLSALERDAEGPRLSTRRIGGPLLFGRLWEQTGCGAVIKDLLAGRGFEFDVERAIFATVLHRLFVSGSDRACDKWMEDYAVPGTDGLALHGLYRAMAWLGEELDAAEGGQAHATSFAPRCVKDRVEEALFERRRDLFSELSVVFMDTTSLRFEGAGGETLGQRGHSKDHRPDLMQLILCVVIDAEGRPICTEIMPGNTADVRILIPTVDRLRHRFAIGRVCIVADRGMISAAIIEGLEQRGLEYILGARERSDRLVREVVLADDRAFTPGSCWVPGWWERGWVACLPGFCDGGRGRREPATPREEPPPSWLHRIWSTSRDCWMTPSASRWCASTGGPVASIVRLATAARWSGTAATTPSGLGSAIGARTARGVSTTSRARCWPAITSRCASGCCASTPWA